MAEGWISLHRKFNDHWIWKKSKKKSMCEAWIDILLEVNYQDAKVCLGNEIIECKRGQSLNSLETWAKRWKWSKSAVRRFLILLQTDSMIVFENAKKTTQITICNYERYQDFRNADETQMKRKRNADETQMKPNNNDNKGNKKEEKNIKKEESLVKQCEAYAGKYDQAMIQAFVEYWTEKDSRGKERWKHERFFEVGKRLGTWSRNNFRKTNGFEKPEKPPGLYQIPDEKLQAIKKAQQEL